MSSLMSVSPIVLRGGSASPRLWFVLILENEPVPDYAGRNRRTNAAIAAPISSGLSSWMKWAPATVISVWFGHVRQKSRIRPVVKDPGSALMKRFGIRSEEHTSELQSLMRISYAVFCLKKKKTTYRKQNH